LLTNGDFTLPAGSPRCDDAGAPAELTAVPDGWTSTATDITKRYVIDGEGILEFMFDECPGGSNEDGFYCALKQGNQLNPDSYVYQTVTSGIISGQSYKLTGFWGAGSKPDDQGRLRPMQIKIEMLNGGPTASVLGERALIVGDTLENLDFDFSPFTPIVGTPSGAQVTIKWYGDNLLNQWSNAEAVYVDDLSLTEASACLNPPEVNSIIDSVTGDSSAPRDSTRTLSISGSNFVPGQTAVKLTRTGELDIVGSITSDASTNITADFVLPGNTAIGAWNVQVDVTDCDPTIVPGMFEIYLAAFANGGFEDPAVGACVPTPGFPTDWQAVDDGHWGSDNRLNMNGYVPGGTLTFVPTCPFEGENYATSARLGAGPNPTRTTSTFQTFAVMPGTRYSFSGFFAADGNNAVKMELLDGGTGDPVLGSNTLSEGWNTYDWRFAFVEGTPTGHKMTASYSVRQLDSSSVETSVHVDDLTVQPCVDTVGVSAIAPETGLNAGVLPLVTISGSGFAGEPMVFLSRPGTAIEAIGVIVESANELRCALDLSDASSGRYDVIVKQEGCISSLTNGFLVVSDSLVNGEFEEPQAPLGCGPGVLAGRPHGWSFDIELVRDHSVWEPTCPRNVPAPTPPEQHGHHGSMTTGFSELPRAWQTLAAEFGARYRFSGYFAGGGGNTVTISLLDGEIDGEPIASTVVQSGLEAYDWTYAEVEAMAPGTVMTILWEMTGTVAGAHASHADGLEFVMIAPGCSNPFADIDNDGDVDQEDFGWFQKCYTGTDGGPIPAEPPACFCFDRENGGMGDGDIDQSDYIAFEDCASGPDIPADPGCED
jgi:hypothetical protein